MFVIALYPQTTPGGRDPPRGPIRTPLLNYAVTLTEVPFAEIGNLCIGRIQVTGGDPRKGPLSDPFVKLHIALINPPFANVGDFIARS